MLRNVSKHCLLTVDNGNIITKAEVFCNRNILDYLYLKLIMTISLAMLRYFEIKYILGNVY